MPYKAFNKDFTCKGKQYEENTTYEENGNEICEAGVMHYCENPFDVLDYYPLVNENGEILEFAEVEPLGKIFKRENKSATNKLHIKAKLGLKGFVKACVDFTLEKTRIETTGTDTKSDNGDNSQLASSGDYSKLASSGHNSKLASSGHNSKLASSGDNSQLASSGYNSKLASSGDYSKLASSGHNSQLASSGDNSQLASSGYNSKLASSGDYSKLASSGHNSQLASEGKHSVVMAAGYDSIAKAKKGSWITLAEWVRTDDIDEKGSYIWFPKYVKTEYVDGERIKEDAFYKLVDGEFKEVEEN